MSCGEALFTWRQDQSDGSHSHPTFLGMYIDLWKHYLCKHHQMITRHADSVKSDFAIGKLASVDCSESRLQRIES